jgi:hypothetical protein
MPSRFQNTQRKKLRYVRVERFRIHTFNHKTAITAFIKATSSSDTAGLIMHVCMMIVCLPVPKNKFPKHLFSIYIFSLETERKTKLTYWPILEHYFEPQAFLHQYQKARQIT